MCQQPKENLTRRGGKRVQKTKIEWCDYTVNCHWGCDNGCPYCQARVMANRFGAYLGRLRAKHHPEIYTPETIRKMAFFEPVFLPDQLSEFKVSPRFRSVNPALPLGSAVIFIDFMSDLFCSQHSLESVQAVMDKARSMPHCTFVFLTKQPQNLRKWSPFPENCWVGVSVPGNNAYQPAIIGLAAIQAKVKFISFEPLLEPLPQIRLNTAYTLDLAEIQWLIIGAETGNRNGKPPLSEVHKWAKEIVEAADKAGIPVFCKDNLNWPVKRQEWPLTNKEEE